MLSRASPAVCEPAECELCDRMKAQVADHAARKKKVDSCSCGCVCCVQQRIGMSYADLAQWHNGHSLGALYWTENLVVLSWTLTLSHSQRLTCAQGSCIHRFTQAVEEKEVWSCGGPVAFQRKNKLSSSSMLYSISLFYGLSRGKHGLDIESWLKPL